MLLKAAQNSHSFVSAACAAKTMLTSLTTRRFFSARGKKKKIEWFDSRNSRLGEWTVGILERRCSGLIRSCWRDSILFICLFWANWLWKLFPSSTYVFFPKRLPHWRQEQNLMKSPDITSCLRLPKPPPRKTSNTDKNSSAVFVSYVLPRRLLLEDSLLEGNRGWFHWLRFFNEILINRIKFQLQCFQGL